MYVQNVIWKKKRGGEGGNCSDCDLVCSDIEISLLSSLFLLLILQWRHNGEEVKLFVLKFLKDQWRNKMDSSSSSSLINQSKAMCYSKTNL